MTPPRELVEAFAAHLRAEVERRDWTREVVIHTSHEPGHYAPVLAALPHAALEPMPMDTREPMHMLRARGDEVLAVLLRETEPLAAELAGEAVTLAGLVIREEAIRAPVLVAAAAELAACWPWPTSDRWPLWQLAALRFLYWRRGTHDEISTPDLPDDETRQLEPPAWLTYGDSLTATIPLGLRTELAAIMGEGFGGLFQGGTVLRTGREGNRVAVSARALAVLYRFERRERWQTSHAFAACEAFASARALGDAQHPGDAHFEAVRLALAPVAGEPDALAERARGDGVTVARLAAELLAWCARVRRELFAKEPPATDDAARVTANTLHGAALRWDVAFAGVLAALGERGAELAAEACQRSAERLSAAGGAGELWLLWFELDAAQSTPPRWVRVLARALWADVWRPALAREWRPVALPRAALLGVLGGALSAVCVEPGDGGRRVLVNRDGLAVARFERRGLATAVQAEALEALAVAGVRELATVAAARFVPWFAHAVQRRHNEAEPLVFEGGDGVNAYGTVAAALGMNPAEDAERVRRLLLALNYSVLSYPDGGEAGVLMLDYRPGGGRGNPSRLTITPGRPWLSSDVHALPDGAEHRALAPIPMLPDLAPPFVGNRVDRAAMARLYLRILVELAYESADIANGLGAHIPGPRWAELAAAEGLRNPGPLALDPLKDRWTRDGDDGPAVFELVGTDRWHLAPAFEAERAMLEAGGRERIGASKGGKLSARKKREARERLAGGKGKPPRRG